MALPLPFAGLVIHYAYLWHSQHQNGLEEGTKNRPCVVVLAATREGGGIVVTVAPVTHSPPKEASEGVEIPVTTKDRLGLDDKRSWVVLTEVNRFRWPGFDLTKLPGQAGVYHYGVLPPGLFRQVRDGILACARRERLKTTPR